jgi:Peptidase family M23
MTPYFLFSALAALAATPVAAAEPITLNWPLDCDLGADCFIQQYVDVDPGPGALDYTCAAATYDGHKGLDIRVPSVADAARGMAVIAAAPGRVRGVRNAVVDRLLRSDADRAAIAGRECGNGVLIDHGNGWETQYCHMAQGSVLVTPGQMVQAGDVLGKVGYSGEAEFAHLHLSVRKDGQVVDPFTGATPDATCGGQQAGLWRDDLRDALAYQPTRIIGVGFSDAGVKLDALEDGTVPGFRTDGTSGALVAYVWAINLKQGDRIALQLRGPAGVLVNQTYDPVPRRKAQQMYFGGIRRPKDGWPAGTYQMQTRVLRQGEELVSRQSEVVVR